MMQQMLKLDNDSRRMEGMFFCGVKEMHDLLCCGSPDQPPKGVFFHASGSVILPPKFLYTQHASTSSKRACHRTLGRFFHSL